MVSASFSGGLLLPSFTDFASILLLADLPIDEGWTKVGLRSKLHAMPAKRAAPSPDAFLKWKTENRRLKDSCVIGRAADSDVVLADESVSRHHALLFRYEEDWWINDLGSRNGVRVNEVRIQHARRLHDGDELRIGAHRLLFQGGTRRQRRGLSQQGATTQVAVDQTDAGQGAVTCELIVATAEGEILEGDKAARWFFGKKLERPTGSAHAYLPPVVRVWLERSADARSMGAGPLELCEADRRVVVTLGRCSEGRYFLLVREESPAIATERLQSLGLSPREAEVMHWVCEGKTNPEIAQILGRTTHTVNRHIEHILEKLGVDNRQKAIVAVMEMLRAR